MRVLKCLNLKALKFMRVKILKRRKWKKENLRRSNLNHTIFLKCLKFKALNFQKWQNMSKKCVKKGKNENKSVPFVKYWKLKSVVNLKRSKEKKIPGAHMQKRLFLKCLKIFFLKALKFKTIKNFKRSKWKMQNLWSSNLRAYNFWNV